jgi:uncharacterized protein (TIGR03437 family)
MRLLGTVVIFGLFAGTAFAQPVVGEGGVLNAASYATGQPVALGSLVAVFGAGLAAELAQADSIPLSTQLGDTRVLFNDIAAPLLFVSSGQINAQMPWEALGGGGTTSGAVNVVVERGGQRSAPRQVQIAPAAPGIFAFRIEGGQVVGFGTGQAIAINPDGSLAGPEGSVPGVPTRPAQRGEVLQVLSVGLGAVNPPAVTGNHSLDQLRLAQSVPTVLVGGREVSGVAAAMSPQFVGIHQVNVPIPADAPTGDGIPLQFRMGDITSTDQVTISIR